MNRRQFLSYLGTASTASAFGNFVPLLAHAQSNRLDGFFVMLYPGAFASTGMDVLLGLDPKLQSWSGSDLLDLGYGDQDVVQPRSGLYLGPCAAPLVPHVNDICVINGVMMREDLGHDSCAHYAGAGSGAHRYLAALWGDEGLNTPYSLASVLGGRESTSSAPFTPSSLRDMQTMAGISDPILDAIHALNGGNSLAQASVRSRPHVARIRQFLRSTDRNTLFPENRSNFSSQELLSAGGLASLLTHEILRMAIWSPPMQSNASDMDSHQDHNNRHKPVQLEYWQGVADLFARFKQTPYKDKSLFDYTTFFAFNEFSRTPNLNSADGKDHNPFTNSFLLAGRGIRGGQVVGRSRALPNRQFDITQLRTLHIAAPMDYQTGRALPDHILEELVTGSPTDAEKRRRLESLSFIFPENVIATLSQAVGLGLPGNHPAAHAPYLRQALKR